MLSTAKVVSESLLEMFEIWEHKKVAAAREEVELEEEDRRAARSTAEHVVIAVSMVERRGRESVIDCVMCY